MEGQFIICLLLLCYIYTICSCPNKRLVSSKGVNHTNLPVCYTPEQQLEVLATLQKCAENNISRVHLNGKRLQGLKMLFKDNPNLKTLEPLLSVSGLGPRVLHRICDSILQQAEEADRTSGEETNRSSEDDNNTQKLRVPASLIAPANISQRDVESVVSIQLGVNAVSWVRLRAEDAAAELDCWGVTDLSDSADSKYDVHSLWQLALRLREEIPDGDIYVLENTNWSHITNIKKPMKFHIQEAMLTTAICSVFNQSDSGREPRLDKSNRVYFLRTYTASRLFRKLVGSERVSGQDVVQEMISGVADERYSPIMFPAGTVDRYQARPGPLRDMMSQALLLAVSFTELVLRRNTAALSVIPRPSKTKTKRH